MEVPGPRTGDIILRREPGGPLNHYSIREFPGLAQVSYSSFAMALDAATRYARSAGTDVLYEESGRYDLIESTTVRTYDVTFG